MVYFNPVDLLEQLEKMNNSNSNNNSSYCLKKSTYSAPLNVIETKEHVFVEAELPGISKDNITIEIKDNQLIISGEKKRINKWTTHTEENEKEKVGEESTKGAAKDKDSTSSENKSSEKEKQDREEEEEQDEIIYHCIERTYGTFKRVLDLSKLHSLDLSNIQASHNNGLLSITIPKNTKLNSISITIQ